MSKRKRQSPKTKIVDGLEGDQARIEDAPGQTHDAPLEELPEGVKEGDVLRKAGGKLMIDRAETRRLKKKAQGKLDQVNEEEPADEISL